MNKRLYIILSVLLAVFLVTASVFAVGTISEKRETISNLRSTQLEEINRLKSSCFYDEAIEAVGESDLKKEDKEALCVEIHDLKSKLKKYEGEVYHIFTHSLIVYPELAFDNDYKHEGYDLWMVTVKEFKGILEEMYQRGYILYDIRELIEKDENGKIKKKDIYLPEGKIPFVYSVDDICYYEYMKNDGFATKLVIDENGEISTVVPDKDGVEQITRDGDVVPIIDDFVKEHPDFSYRGAKGVLAVTGYEGILGYRFPDSEGDEYEKALREVAPVVEKLKENGWVFASHSYTHNNYFKDLTVTMAQMEYDSSKWDRLIKKATGDTNIYISPFGYTMNQEDERYRYLIETFDFDIFCPVGGTLGTKYYDDNIVMGRYAVDGLSLKHSKKLLSKFFDCDLIKDNARGW